MTTQGEIRGLPLTFFIVILAFVILMSVVLISIRGIVKQPKEESQSSALLAPGMLPLDFSFLRMGSDVSGIPPSFGENLVEIRGAYRNKQYAQAEDLLRTLLLYYPESPTVLKMLADVLYMRKDFLGAEHFYQKRLSMNPDDALTLNDLAMAQGRQGNYTDAIRNMHEVLRLNPDFHEAEWNLAGLYIQAGRKEEALQYLKTALRKTGKMISAIDLDEVFLPLLNEPEIRTMIVKSAVDMEKKHE